MASLTQTISSACEDAWKTRGKTSHSTAFQCNCPISVICALDTRIDDWLLMDSPALVVVICATYFVSAKFLGFRFMQNRQPFDLRRIIVIYNIFQILSNAWIVYVLIKGWWGGNITFFCDAGESYTNPDVGIPILRGAHLFFLIKFVDFFDTLFFILHKKNSHVSWLHVYHHSIMPIAVWLGIRFVGSTPGILYACLNATIHVFMYFYYFLTGLGPRYKKFLFWKKYLTMMQLGQFIIAALHSLILLFLDCDLPVARYGAMFLPLEVSFFFLFMNFYRKTYIQKTDKSA